MKTTNQICVKPIISVTKAYEPKFEIINTYTENENGVWFLYLVNVDKKIFKYRLDFYESEQ